MWVRPVKSWSRCWPRFVSLFRNKLSDWNNWWTRKSRTTQAQRQPQPKSLIRILHLSLVNSNKCRSSGWLQLWPWPSSGSSSESMSSECIHPKTSTHNTQHKTWKKQRKTKKKKSNYRARQRRRLLGEKIFRGQKFRWMELFVFVSKFFFWFFLWEGSSVRDTKENLSPSGESLIDTTVEWEFLLTSRENLGKFCLIVNSACGTSTSPFSSLTLFFSFHESAGEEYRKTHKKVHWLPR